MAGLSEECLTETMHSAKGYIAKLQHLVKLVEAAELQVESSATFSTIEVENTFKHLTNSIVDLLNKRRDVLLSEISNIRRDGIAPLRACREIIASKITDTETYVAEGCDIMRIGGMAISESTEKFVEKASFLGSLPAVPNLEEVPYISFQCNFEAIEDQVAKQTQSLGRVSCMGPVQITEVEEKPGALLVHWEEVDFEHAVDIHAFRLQYAYGDIRNKPHLMETNFHTVYQGPDSQFLVRELRSATMYTFRVCCLAEGETDWSAWSLPCVASCNIPPFSWEQKNSDYLVTNDGKIACKVNDQQSLLVSSGPQFGPGHSIEFSVLECGSDSGLQGLGLFREVPTADSMMHQGILFVSISGSIYVDGAEKMMKLPPLSAGSKVCFLCEHLRDEKLRMHIGAADKTVIYDWNPVGDSSDISPPKLYFALSFQSKGWKVLVE